MENNDPENFLVLWHEPLQRVRVLLEKLHEYDTFPEHFLIQDVITPDELIDHQKEWVRLYGLFEPEEQEFFKPWWVPMMRNKFSYFLDMSDPGFPVYDYMFIGTRDLGWVKYIFFNSLVDYLEKSNNDPTAIGVKSKQALIDEISRVMKVRDNKYYEGIKETELPRIDEIPIQEGAMMVLNQLNNQVLYYKGTTSMILGFLPFDIPVKIKKMDLVNPSNYGKQDYSRVKNIGHLTYYFRLNGPWNIKSFEIEFPDTGSRCRYYFGHVEFIDLPVELKTLLTDRLRENLNIEIDTG